MTFCNRLAALGVVGLSLLFAWSAGRALVGIVTGNLQADLLFGVVTCCDIPQSEVVARALSAAIPLIIAAYIGRWLTVGLWRGRRDVARGALLWLAIVTASQIVMAQGKVSFVQAEHYQLAGFAAFVLAMALPLALSRRVEPKPAPDGPPIASPHG